MKRRRTLDEFVQTVPVLPFDEAAASTAARLRYELEKTGTSIGPLDTLIAGIAIAHAATLVTNNTREFNRVPGLRVVDWF